MYDVTPGMFVQLLLTWKSRITYYECVFVALVIQYKKIQLPYYNVICSLSSSTTFLPHYLKQHDFLGGKRGGSLNIKCVLLFSLQLFSETFSDLRRTEQDIYIYIYTHTHTHTHICLHVTCPLFLSHFDET